MEDTTSSLTPVSHLGRGSLAGAMAPTGPGSPRLWRVASALSIAQTALYVAVYATTNIILPAQISSAVGSQHKEAWLGIITTCAAVVAMVLSPLAGTLSDRTRTRIGRRAPWILAAGAVLFLGLAPLGALHSAGLILVAWCVTQLGFATMVLGLTTVLPERVPLRRRGLISGVTGFTTALAAGLSGFFGAAVLGHPLVGTFVLAALILVGAAAFLVILPEPSTVDLPLAERSSERLPVREALAVFFSAFQDHNFRWMWLGRCLVTLGYYMLLTRQLYYVEAEFGQNTHDAAAPVATVSAAAGLFTVIGLVASGPLSDRWGRLPFVYFGSGLTGLSLLAVVLAPNPDVFMIIWAVASLGYGSFVGVDAALAADVLPAGDGVAKDLGIINLAQVLPQTIAPAAGSLILAFTAGSYNGVLILGAVFTFVGIFATTRLQSVR